MKRHYHISASGVLAALAAVRELYGEVPGTGQSLMDLAKDGWSYLSIQRYFPWEAVNSLLVIGALIWFAISFSGRRERKPKESQ